MDGAPFQRSISLAMKCARRTAQPGRDGMAVVSSLFSMASAPSLLGWWPRPARRVPLGWFSILVQGAGTAAARAAGLAPPPLHSPRARTDERARTGSRCAFSHPPAPPHAHASLCAGSRGAGVAPSHHPERPGPPSVADDVNHRGLRTRTGPRLGVVSRCGRTSSCVFAGRARALVCPGPERGWSWWMGAFRELRGVGGGLGWLHSGPCPTRAPPPHPPLPALLASARGLG